MSNETLMIIAIVVAAVVVVVAVWMLFRRRKTAALRARFGPEYTTTYCIRRERLRRLNESC